MNHKRTLFYAITLGGLLAFIFWVLNAGQKLTSSGAVISNKVGATAVADSPFQHPLAVFLLQLAVIIVASQVFAFLFRKMGQPSVMGEIIAGIVLGPSVVGALLPEFSSIVFPVSSLGNLQMLSQVGLILFMFVIGIELDLKVLQQKAGSAVIISHASIVIPYALGVALSYFMYREYAVAGTPFYGFSLFMGIAMSVTAFPVLARVIRERGLQNTRLGTIAITCAAADDITAWCLLAVVLGIVKANTTHSIYTLMFAAGYVGIMLLFVRPMLRKLTLVRSGIIQRSTLAIVFVILLGSAYAAEVIGIHALFGAFLAGVIMPADWDARKILIDKIEDVALVLLLPLFFVFTGLRTEIGLLNTPSLWMMCFIIILIAITGKFGGSALAAKITGETTQDSLAIGALMNTRGLMELVVLNIGYDLGILSAQVFTMMVIMALTTTLMTAPILNLIDRYRPKQV